ncbi:hypothetical protein LCGC14_0863530, partial [marine sediment metagenome]
FYCEQRFIKEDPKWCQEWDHLNNNPQDNRPENMVWAHAQCNEKKKYNIDWNTIAAEKLKKNVKLNKLKNIHVVGKGCFSKMGEKRFNLKIFKIFR